MAVSGSGEPSMTTEKRRGLLLIFILWGYLSKATARQIIGSGSGKPRMTTEKTRGLLLIHILWGYDEKGDDVAGSGSGEPSMTIEKTRGLTGATCEKRLRLLPLISILWGYLRRMAPRKVVTQMG